MLGKNFGVPSTVGRLPRGNRFGSHRRNGHRVARAIPVRRNSRQQVSCENPLFVAWEWFDPVAGESGTQHIGLPFALRN